MCQAQVHNLQDCPTFLQRDADGRIHLLFQYGLHHVCMRTCGGGYACNRRNMACGVDNCDRFHHPFIYGARCGKLWYHKGPGGPPQAVRDAYAAQEAAKRAAAATARQQAQQQGQAPARATDGIGPGVHLAMAEFGQHLRLLYIFVRRIGANAKKYFDALALIDGGCTRTFIREHLARQMGLTVKAANRVLNSVHGLQSELMASVSFEIGCPLDPQHDRTPAVWETVGSACTHQEMALSGPTVRWADWARDHPPFQDIAEQLSTVNYQDVDIYLGIDMEHLCTPIGPVHVSPCGRYRAQCCALGWTVSGPAVGMNPYHVFAMMVGNTEDSSVEIEEIPQLARAFTEFNSLEAVGIVPAKDKYSHRERLE